MQDEVPTTIETPAVNIQPITAPMAGVMTAQTTTSDARLDNGPHLISALEEFIGLYLVVLRDILLVLSLYIVNSYLWEDFDFCAYLAIVSPTKRCGKSTLAQILAWLCRLAIITVDPTGPATFRIIADRRPTLICDEAEKYVADSRLRALLNAGFKKGAVVPRCVGGQVEDFPVFCPKMFCIVGELPESLRDRSIVIAMRRAKPGEVKEELRERIVSRVAKDLAQRIADWCAANRQEIVDCYNTTSVDFLPDREANIWAPLFAIARIAIPDQLDSLKAVALRLIGEKQKQDQELSPAVRLLVDLRTIFATERAPMIPTNRVLAELRSLPDGPWRGLSASHLADLLRPFSIAPDQHWIAGRNLRGYLRCDFIDAFDRYIPAELPHESDSESGNSTQTNIKLAC